MDYSEIDSITSGIVGGMLIFYVILFVLVLAIAIVGIVASWKLYKKAGKAGWESIVPFYSNWVLVEIAGLDWWWFLLTIAGTIVGFFDVEGLSDVASLVSTFATFNIYYNIARRFNKEKGTAICAGIFSGIFVLIFGFSKKEVYNANIPVSKNGIFGPVENTMSNYQNNTYSQPVQNNAVNNTVNNTVVNNAEPVSAAQEYSFCSNCGTKIEKNAAFCPNCGNKNSL